ncbi:MAG: recombinase family protein, partial [Phycisphaerales bacterium]
LIFRMYTEQGKGFKSVAEALNLDEIPTPRGPAWSHIYTGQWTDTTIRSILVNPVYVGDMVWNRRTDARFYQIRDGRVVERESVHGARLVPNNESDWLVVRDVHPALISRRVFEQARQRRENQPSSIEQRGKNLRGRTNGRIGNGLRSRFILSGLLTCSLCRNRYQGVTRNKGRKRVNGSNIVTRYYGCGGHITKGKSVCEMNVIPQSELETLVTNAVLDFYQPYLAKGGRRKVAEVVKQQAGSESAALIGGGVAGHGTVGDCGAARYAKDCSSDASAAIGDREPIHDRCFGLAIVKVKPASTPFAVDGAVVRTVLGADRDAHTAEIEILVARPGVCPVQHQHSVEVASGVDAFLDCVERVIG